MFATQRRSQKPPNPVLSSSPRIGPARSANNHSILNKNFHKLLISVAQQLYMGLFLVLVMTSNLSLTIEGMDRPYWVRTAWGSRLSKCNWATPFSGRFQCWILDVDLPGPFIPRKFGGWGRQSFPTGKCQLLCVTVLTQLKEEIGPLYAISLGILLQSRGDVTM